ncbi:MAG: sn-glycerol-1-phosphate dehydrogenase [Clostridiales bacterium]|nr:sn-glycerol-1-phosphate dehydrogenase [Clostridiales bacterium]
MDIGKLIESFKNCSCGREHDAFIKDVEIASGLISDAGKILDKNGFPKKILVVADKNTLKAADGLLEVLKSDGYKCDLRLYDDLRVADMTEVDAIRDILKEGEDGVLSVGTGSLNDICRLGSYKADKPFAIFATAPSMDGFASDTAPITENGFKVSYQARQPSVVMADTRILAAAPTELKSAGFGDMIAKCVGLADWKLSTLLTGEYYCDRVASLTKSAFDKIVSMADRVTRSDEETAGAIMEALVMTGVAMQFGKSSRPASGAEHIVSHFWEIKELEQGVISDFHGKKVGVATIMINRLYKEVIKKAKKENFIEDHIDWAVLSEVYGKNFIGDVKRLNEPTITEGLTAEKVRDCWDEICRIYEEELPSEDELMRLMKAAGAVTTLKEIAVPDDLGVLGLKYHPYMRHRLNLSRIIPMLHVDIDYERIAGLKDE